MFLLGAIFGQVIDDGGSAQSIALTVSILFTAMANWIGTVLLILSLKVGIDVRQVL